MRTYYQILDLPPQASAADIRRAYRRLVLLTHPDRTPDPAAHTHYLAVNEAYETLSDPRRRQHYDAQLRGHHRPAPPPLHRRPAPPFAWRRRATRTIEYKEYARPARRWCRSLLLLPSILFFDYFLLTRSVEAQVLAFRATYLPTTTEYFVTTTQGSFSAIGYLENTDFVTLKASRLFSFVSAATLLNGQPLTLTSQAYSLWSFAVLLTGVALLGQSKRLSPTANINAAITGTMLALIVFLMVVMRP